MRSSKFRILRFLELKLGHGSDAPTREPWNLRQILEHCISNSFHQRAPRENAARFVRIRHAKFVTHAGRDYAALLFVLADSESVNASYENMQTGAARTFEKELNEGYRTEAHMVIDLNPTMRGTTQVYAVALEESSGLSGSVIVSRLLRPLRMSGGREMEDSSGAKLKWGPEIALDGLLSGSLIDEIAAGDLQAFDLVREQIENRGLDEHGDLIQKRVTMQIDVVSHPDAGEIRQLLSRVRNIAARQNYEQVRIRYTESGTKKSKSAVLDVPDTNEDSDASEALEKLVSRTAKVNLSEALHYDHTEVVDSFVHTAILKLVAEQDRR